MSRLRPLYSIIASAAFWLCIVSPSFAEESVEVVVAGIEGDVLENVRQALALPSGLVREGKVDQLWLERFVRQADENIHSALEPFGYYNARVAVRVEKTSGEKYRLMVKVEPGEPVRVAEVIVVVQGPGAGQDLLNDSVAAFPLKKGSVLLQLTYEQAKGALKSRAQQLGYLDADFSRHEIRITKPASAARIELVLETGEQYRFNGIRIEGAPDYPDIFLKRHLAFKTGEVFSYAKLGETQLNFTNADRFKEVIVTPEKQESEAFKVSVLIQLKPAPRRSLRPGIGYGTDTGGRFTLRYRDLNMFQQGHEFYTNLYVAERLQGIVSGYILPSSKDIRSSTTVQLNLQREDVTAYISRLIALEFAENRSFAKGEVGTAYLKLQQEEFTIGTQNSSSRLVLPGLRFTKDLYDNLVRPSRGFRYAVDLRGTHQFLGSDSQLLQVITEGGYFLPMPWRLSLHTRAKIGITLFNDTLKDLPPSLRFFAGGDQSVRGYSYKSLGPTDATGQISGGKHLLTGSVELERALFKNWGVSVFYDAGNAFNSFTDIGLFHGAGVGLHYYTPVGALNLSLARQINVTNPGYHVHFTVGFEL